MAANQTSQVRNITLVTKAVAGGDLGKKARGASELQRHRLRCSSQPMPRFTAPNKAGVTGLKVRGMQRELLHNQ